MHPTDTTTFEGMIDNISKNKPLEQRKFKIKPDYKISAFTKYVLYCFCRVARDVFLPTDVYYLILNYYGNNIENFEKGTTLNIWICSWNTKPRKKYNIKSDIKSIIPCNYDIYVFGFNQTMSNDIENAITTHLSKLKKICKYNGIIVYCRKVLSISITLKSFNSHQYFAYITLQAFFDKIAFVLMHSIQKSSENTELKPNCVQQLKNEDCHSIVCFGAGTTNHLRLNKNESRTFFPKFNEPTANNVPSFCNRLLYHCSSPTAYLYPQFVMNGKFFEDGYCHKYGTISGYDAIYCGLQWSLSYNAAKHILYVKTYPANKRITLNVWPYDTIFNIKTKIQNEEQIPADKQRLISKNKELQNDKALSDYGIPNEGTIIMMRRYNGNEKQMCRYNTPN